MGKTPIPPLRRLPNETHEDYMKRIQIYRDHYLAPHCSMSGNMGSVFLYAVFGVSMIILQ